MTDTTKININLGSTGLLDIETVDKKAQYKHLLTEITSETFKQMAMAFEENTTRTGAFKTLEDRGVNLEYLIALGLTNEETIYAYQTLRERGLLTQDGAIQENFIANEDYALEVSNLERPLPEMKTIDGDSVTYQPTYKSLNKDLAKDLADKELEIRKLKRQIESMEDIPTPEPEQDPDDLYEKQVIAELQKEIDISEFEPTEEEKQEQEETAEWLVTLNKIKAQRNQEHQAPEAEADSDEEIKRVYVVASEIDVGKEEVPGYEIIKVETANDLYYFTSSRNNLLVITEDIPRHILKVFISWINGLTVNNQVSYRIVTLKGKEMEHALIEAVVELTKESLDNYYIEHELSQYTGDGVGSFLDIADIF